MLRSQLVLRSLLLRKKLLCTFSRKLLDSICLNFRGATTAVPMATQVVDTSYLSQGIGPIAGVKLFLKKAGLFFYHDFTF